MSLTIVNDFTKSGYDLVACHSPLVLVAYLINTNTSQNSGDVTVEIQGAGDNTNLYVFDMGYVSSVSMGAPYRHTFKLDITDIIRKICNDPDLRDEVTTNYFTPSRLATGITLTVKSSGESNQVISNTYMHGFNQVNDPDSSCLVDFADPAGEALISIVPGAPMLWDLWNPVQLSGTYYVRLYDEDANIVYGVVLPNPAAKGLWQVYSTGINDDLYNAWEDKEEVFSLYFQTATPGLNGNAVIKGIALKQACEGDILLAWLNRYGIYSYMAFERYPTHTNNQQHIGGYDLEVYDIADLQSRQKSRGFKDVHTIISAVARGVPAEYFPAIEDLYYSMDVYLFTGNLPKNEHDDADWLRVTVRGQLIEKKKHSVENVRVDIILPEKYTQLR